jgi:peroxiredoxin Q/BCP
MNENTLPTAATPPLARRLAMVMTAAALVAASVSMACATTGSTLPAVGTPAPAFAARDQTGQLRTNQEFLGKPLVLFFYPSDGTPGCTTEACAFRNAWQRYEQAGVAIVGVSTNDVASHASFAAEHKLPFPLLADVDGAILRAWGVSSMLGLSQRVSVLIDRDGRVARVFQDVDPALHAQEVLAAAAALTPTPTPTPTPTLTPTPPPTPTPTTP